MNNKNSEELIVGIDLGGTKILAGVFNRNYECLGTGKKKTQAGLTPDMIIERIVVCVQEALESSKHEIEHIRAIGIGSPGSIDTDRGMVLFAGNLGWKNVPLKEELERRLNKPVSVGNDCNVATLGVYHVEYKARPEQMACFFLGTGIGGGLILNRQLYTGPGHTAFEIGHMVLQIDGPECTSGIRGTWEALASRQAITRQIVQAVEKGRETVLTEISKKGLSKIKSRILARALMMEDELVREVITEASRITGIALANVINILNIQQLVLGGGLIEALEEFMLPVIRKSAEEHSFPGAFTGVKINATRLADDAGITGAAVLAGGNPSRD